MKKKFRLVLSPTLAIHRAPLAPVLATNQQPREICPMAKEATEDGSLSQ